jgi:NADH:ubiquinone oxidoreductase subunit 6 (subunit J)
LRGDQFEAYFFRFTWSDIWQARVPLVSGWIAGELGPVGLLAAAAGLVVLWRRSWRTALLLALVFLAVAGLALENSASDVEVFLILPMLTVWVFAGVGLDRGLTWLEDRRLPDWMPPVVTRGALAGLALVLPGSLIAANLGVNNERAHRFEMDYFEALFRQLPGPTAFVEEDHHIVTSMVRYKVFGERAGPYPDVRLIRPDRRAVEAQRAAGVDVYAFPASRLVLEAQGVEFEPVSFELPFPASSQHVYDADLEPLTRGLWRATGGRGPLTMFAGFQ